MTVDHPRWVPLNRPSWLMSGSHKNPFCTSRSPLRYLFAPSPFFSHPLSPWLLDPLLLSLFSSSSLPLHSTANMFLLLPSGTMKSGSRSATPPPVHQVVPVPLRSVKCSSFLCGVSQPGPSQVKVGGGGGGGAQVEHHPFMGVSHHLCASG